MNQWRIYYTISTSHKHPTRAWEIICFAATRNIPDAFLTTYGSNNFSHKHPWQRDRLPLSVVVALQRSLTTTAIRYVSEHGCRESINEVPILAPASAIQQSSSARQREQQPSRGRWPSARIVWTENDCRPRLRHSRWGLLPCLLCLPECQLHKRRSVHRWRVIWCVSEPRCLVSVAVCVNV